MGMEKNMNARIQHKHDTEANWNKALNFIPKIGEIIIYDIDENHNYSRFKIGDGVRTISNLEFSQTDLTGYATESYVNTQVANLVNTAPEALNTLDELAAALGDDPNFATTVITEIGKKVNTADLGGLATKDSLTASEVGALPLSGGTMTGEIKIGQGDGKGIQLGTNGRINATVGTNTKATMFGISNGIYYLGHSGFNTTIRGAKTRPTYNGNDMALSSDVTSLSSEIGKKVDKVDGKGLSTNDFTNEYKEKLDSLENIAFEETDPTVPAWAKASSKPSYTKSEVGLGNVDNVKQYSANNPPPYPVTSVNGSTGAVTIKAVPNCSTSNNGQFLRVVNGVAAWSTVPNAEEATF